MTKVDRRQYTAQTKADAVGQVIKAGLPVQQVARSFDMPVQTLGKWVSNARKGVIAKPGANPISDQTAEISRLKTLCARLTMERDILKKATAYFAKDLL